MELSSAFKVTDINYELSYSYSNVCPDLYSNNPALIPLFYLECFDTIGMFFLRLLRVNIPIFYLCSVIMFLFYSCFFLIRNMKSTHVH